VRRSLREADERDRRRARLAETERRRAARALDRYVDSLYLSSIDVPQHLGMGASREAGDRFVEAVGDYVLSRLHHKSQYGVPRAGCPARTTEAFTMAPVPCSLPAGHDYAHRWDFEGRSGTFGVQGGVSDASAVHVPHRHLHQDLACSSVDCHALDGRPCTYCGGAPCRVVLTLD
jgi:hypothetical protein